MNLTPTFITLILFFLFYFLKVHPRNEEYDIVYTWVNGSDPNHIKELSKYLGVPNKNLTNRFRDNNELRYSLRSVEKFAPWVRNVYLVTSGHFPYWLNTKKVQVIPHTDIFLNQSHLPTFSSPSIEANIHRIRGLSSKYIYLNDDVFFGNDITPLDFLNSDGYKVFLTWDVPGCAEGCQDKYIGDGYCDSACNVAECNFDGGDCKNKQEQCNDKCNEKWFSDLYCDSACNTLECAFDGGDCGKSGFIKYVREYKNMTLPNDTPSLLLNLTRFGEIKTAYHNNPKVIRSSSVSQTYKTLFLTFNKKKRSNVAVVVNDKKINIHFDKAIKQKNDTKITEINLQTRKTQSFQRKLLGLDKFGASLVHVNKLLNKDYERIQRKVPAHMPHFIDKNIMNEVVKKWEKEFNVTSSNRFRSDDDMQYTFSYFYYLIHHGKKEKLSDVFKKVDRNNNGILEPYEVQLLAYMFWKQKVNIGENQFSFDGAMTQEYHDIFNKKLNQSLSEKSPKINYSIFKSFELAEKIPRRRIPKYKHQMMELDQVAFHMIRDSPEDVNNQLDGVRFKLPKFVCLNDDMNSTSPHPEVVKTLNNFYEWYFPQRSQFELPDGTVNSITNIIELRKSTDFEFKLFLNLIIIGIVILFIICLRFCY